jgi:hypothetical protein
MQKMNKTSQLQIRVSPEEKAQIMRYARKSNMSVSEWVLNKALPPAQRTFQDLLSKIGDGSGAKYALAELHDLLKNSNSDEFELMVCEPPPLSLSSFYLNYIAAMVEYAAALKGRKAPSWTKDIKALEEPHFGSDLKSLRLYLLTHSPPPFRKRNIFIDSTIGKRV